ncbi:MAG: CDGSH iron-sulfur domain-containing protein [Chlorobi bacterium]|nr:CDGSH iron-sulfur domain-containing protein [Chlorobiota bacterium]MCI0715769.1 CDGSH iron-sulfur domain-containing protein [Chlorobiota bacterium]
MPTRILIKSNGSIKVEGDDFELVDENGNKFDLAGRTKISLCRCGQSSKKPFCDSTHKTCGFESVIVAYALEPKKED